MTVRKSDELLQGQVMRALEWDSRVAHAPIAVRVDDAVVTLLGTTSSYAEKLAAAEAAHRVPGVLDVADQLEVIVPGGRVRTDTEIAKAVRTALEWNAFVPDERIQSTVADGWVTLEGRVDLLRESDDAERAITGLEGVRGVINKIGIGGPDVDPETLHREIDDALTRHAKREAGRIKVQVDAGAVTVSGTVDSWSERRAVLGVLRHAPGVRTVHDALEIDPRRARSREQHAG